MMDLTESLSPDRRQRTLAHIALDVLSIFLCSLLLAALIFDQPAFVQKATDADKLVPAELVRDVFTLGYPFSSFQLPRVPSLFPDLTVYTLAELATGSWRFATFLFGLVQLAGLTVAAGLIVRQITGRSFITNCQIFLLVSLPILALEILHSGQGRHLQALMVVAHGGQFVLSLFCAVLAVRTLASPTPARIAALFVLATVGFLSDPLFLFEFQFPIALAALMKGIAERRLSREYLVVWSISALSVAIGWIVYRHLNLQAAPPMEVDNISPTFERFMFELTPSTVVGSFIPAAVLLAAPLAIGCLAKEKSTGAMLRAWHSSAHTSTRLFYWTFATVAVIATTVFACAFLYEDKGSYRYFLALFWWPNILLSALIATAAGRHSERLLPPLQWTSILCLGFFVLPSLERGPLIFTSTNDLAACLMAHRKDLSLRAGLAGYWDARPIAASTNWAINVGQIAPDGSMMYWGNDLLSYYRSAVNSLRPPRYSFIVMRGLERRSIAARYAPPDQVLECPGSDVWVYNDGSQVYRALTTSSAR